MKNMTRYYISRGILSVVFGVVFVILGNPLWMGILVGVLGIAFFIWAPHSGRYAVHPKYGATALRRDERTQAINDKAGRNAFVALILVLGGILLQAQFAGVSMVPVVTLYWLLFLGAVVYFLSDNIQRKNT